ncbi:MAG: hypothetical protein ACXVQJ_09390 [Actinomycetota bacterium]
MQATAAVVRDRLVHGGRAGTAVVSAGTALAAFLYVAMRASTARSVSQIHSFAGYCQRVQPPDPYPCHMAFTGQARAYLAATLLLWIGLAGVALVLALAGRGLWSFAPLLALPLARGFAWLRPEQLTALPWLGVRSSPYFTNELGQGYWASHGLRASLADLALLAAPAALVLLIRRPPRAGLSWRGRPAFVLTTLLCLAAGATVAWFTGGSTWQSLGYSNGIEIWLPAAVMASFGLLLPRGPWRPWSIGVAAVLLSSGPSALLLSSFLRMPTTLWFAQALPLAAIGLLASSAEPLAVRWERRKERGTAEPARARSSRLRPVVVLHALALGLVAVSVVAASADPLGIQIGTALPTYLGLRERAQDVRAKEDLLAALRSFDTYRFTHGFARGFEAAQGRVGNPSLLWADSATQAGHLTMSVVRATPTLVRIVTLSASGAAFCAQSTRSSGWSPTYGSGAGSDRAVALDRAETRCGAAPLTRATIPVLPVATLCDGVDQDQIILCRAVQHVVEDTLADPRGRLVN